MSARAARLAVLVIAVASVAAEAQPADSLAVRNTMTPGSGPPSGAATGGRIGVDPPRRYVSGPPPAESWERALAEEVGGTVGGGSAGVLLTRPVLRRRLGASDALGLSATALLGVRRAAGGLFASAGVATDLTVASVGAGAWAETSPAGRALGPAVEARVRVALLRGEAGAVVAGSRARWLRVGLDLPLLVVVGGGGIVVGGGGVAFVGVSVEARRFDETGQTLRTVAVSLSL